MDLKFYLNKFIKVDCIEGYTLKALREIQKRYEDYLEKTGGSDPDFPMMTFGGKSGGKKVKGQNAESEYEETNNKDEEI